MAAKDLFASLTFKLTDVVPRPDPPPLPEYDINDEPPMWTWARCNRIPYIKPKPYPKVGAQPDSDDEPDWRGVIKSKVIELPKPGPYSYGLYTREHYYWFDTPDYADPFKKLWYATKFYFATGGIVYAIGLAILPDIKGTPLNLKLFGKITSVWLGSGLVASLACLSIANARGNKDDMWNYAIAGFIQGSIIGRKNHLSWFRWSFGLAALGAFLKHANEHNWTLMQRTNWRLKNSTLSGMNAEGGFWTGDYRDVVPPFWKREPDPGRDIRKTY